MNWTNRVPALGQAQSGSLRAGGGRRRADWRRRRAGALRAVVENLEIRQLLSGEHGPEPMWFPDGQFVVSLDNGALTGPSRGRPLDLALNYLSANAGRFGLQAADVDRPFVTDLYQDPGTGITHVYLRQRHNELPVANANMNVNVASDGRILSVGGAFVPLAGERAVAGAAVALVSPGQAVDAVRGVVFGDPAYPITKEELPGGGGVSWFSVPAMSLDPVVPRLYYLATQGGGVDLAWNFSVRTTDNDHWYDLNVDAATGAFVGGVDWVSHASYNVYGAPTEAPNDANGTATRVVLGDPHDAVASPWGWHDTNGVMGPEFTDTRGNNVFAQEDADANNTGGFRPDGGAGLVFDFPVDFTQAPSAYRSAAITNLFYWNNYLHDLHYHYGFTEAAGNFQFTNYTGQGLGNDAVQADAQDGSGTNNANFATPPDGQQPRMQMYLFTRTTPGRDGDFSNDIIVHEYGHGVSNRLTGGPSNSSALQTTQSRGMGEGWSDWWALMLTQEATDAKMGSRGSGTYVLGQAITGGGIRRYPYSFDMSKNPLTINHFNTDASKEVHNTGEIWASVLWDMNWLLIDKHGFSTDMAHGYSASDPNRRGGNNLALRLVMDALKLQPANPSFAQARDAILQADQNLTGGANRVPIWTAFARRGMGYSFNSGTSSSSTTVTPAFDVPPGLLMPRVTASAPAGPQTSPVSAVEFTFSEAMNPASFDVSSDVVSFTGPGGVDLRPSISGVTWLNGNTTLRISFAAVSTNGQYALTIGPQILAADDGAAMDQDADGTGGEATQDRYTATFGFDAVQLQVVSTQPANGSVVTLPFTTLDVHFNEAVDPATVGVTDLVLSQGSVTAATVVGATTVRYTLSGVSVEAAFTVTMAAGAVSDASGFPMAAYAGTLMLDTGTVPFPTPLTLLGDGATRVYEGSATGTVAVADDTDSYVLPLDAGQLLTVVLAPAGTLRPVIEVRDAGNAVVASVTATAAGDAVVAQTIAVTAAGDYTIIVRGAAGTGAYTLRATLNAAVEPENYGGAANDTIATAADLGPAFVPLASGAAMASVVGRAPAALAAPVATWGAGAGLVQDGEPAALASAVGPGDYYKFELAAGESATVVVKRVGTAGSVTLDLYDALGNLLAVSGASASNFDRSIVGFVAPAAGRYYVAVSGDGSADYVLSVARNLDVDAEGNDTTGTAQRPVASPVGGRWYAAGYVEATPATAQAIDFGEIQAGAINGKTIKGAAFKFQVAGVDSTDAAITTSTGPGAMTYVTPPVVEGTSSGVLTITLPGASSTFGFGMAMSTGTAVSSAVVVQLYNGSTLVATVPLSISVRPPYGFSEGLFSYSGAPVDKAVLDFNETAAARFVIDNVTFGTGGGGSTADVYAVTLTAGVPVRFTTSTPGGGAGLPVNGLNPSLRLLSSAGTQLAANDDGAPDGRNAMITFLPNASGTYYIEVSSAAGSMGQYVLSAEGVVAPASTLTVSSVTPAGGASLAVKPTAATLTFSNPLLLTSLQAGDLRLDGQPLGSYTLSGDRTAVFALPANLPPGLHTLTIGAGDIADIRGGTLGAFSSTFTVLSGPLTRFGWSGVPSPQPVGVPFPVTITAQDANDNTVTTFGGTVSLSGLVGTGGTGPSLLISEAYYGSADFVEFTNVSTSPVNVGGWQVYIYDVDYWPAPRPGVFTFPAGTTVPAGGVLRLVEYGTSPGAYPTFYTGQNINWTSSTGARVAVLLRDGANQIVDFMAAASATPASITSPTTIPAAHWQGATVPAGLTDSNSYQRYGNSDDNDATDWRAFAVSGGTFNTGLTMPFTGAGLVIGITPTTATFVNGVWTGTITVLQTAKGMQLRVDDGAGHVSLSNAFDAIERGVLLSLPASANEGGGTLTGTVTLTHAGETDVTVTLTSADPGRLSAPATVIVPAGQTSATFAVEVPDNGLLDGPQAVTVTGTAATYAVGTASVTVQDDESAVLTVSLPDSATEGVGTVVGTITGSAAPTRDITIQLVSGTTSRLTVPATVVLPAGQMSVTFPATVVNDTLINGTGAVTVTASAGNWTPGADVIDVADNDAFIELILPASAWESQTLTGTVRIGGTLPTPLVVNLVSGDTSELTVPVTVTIAAGATSATFTLTFPSDGLNDGTQTAGLTATASGLADAAASVPVRDADVDRLAFDTITGPKTAAVAFAATARAYNVENQAITVFAGSGTLTAVGQGGATLPVTPTGVNFTNGVWTGNVAVAAVNPAASLWVTAGGKSAESNTFAIQPGAVASFQWDAVVSPQVAGVPFAATVTAKDANGFTVTGFNGPATLSGYAGDGVASQTMLTAPTHTNSNNNGTYTVGYAFTPTSNILVTHVRRYFGTKVSIWTNTGTLLASQAVSGAGATWTETALSTPVQLQAGTTYRITVYTGGQLYYWRNVAHPNPSFATMGATYEISGDAFPTSPDPGQNWLIDLRGNVGTAVGVPVSPTTATFAGGVWTGNVTVAQPGTGVRLRVSDGTRSGESNAFDVLPDPTAPSTPDLLAASDSGVSDADNLTNRNNSAPGKALSFSVGNTVPGAVVSLYYGSTLIGSAVATSDTTVVTTNGTTTLPDGVVNILARQTPPGGAESGGSTPIAVTIDTVAPTTPAAPDLQSTSDTGYSTSDNITKVNAPTFAVSASPYFRFFRNGAQLSADYATGSAFTVETQADGTHTYGISAVDAAGNASAVASLNVVIDTVAPRVTNSSVQDGAVRAPGALAYAVTFSEAMPTGTIDSADHSLRANLANVLVTPSASWSGNTLTLSYPALAEDAYTLTLLSAALRFEDLAGNLLDGEGNFPIPPNTSGDGTAGGNFVVNFSVDAAATAFPTLAAQNPRGSLVYSGSASGAIGAAGDTDSFTISLDPGQTLTVVARPTSTLLRPAVTLTGPGGAMLGSATAVAANQDAVLQTIAVATGGTYTVTVSGAGGTVGLYSLQLLLNAATEVESTAGGANNNARAAAQDLSGSFIALAPGAGRAAVVGTTDLSASDYYSFTAAAAGEVVQVAYKNLAGTAFPAVTLQNAAGTTLATAAAGATNVDRVLSFVVPSDGTYYVVVGSTTSASTYNLVVGRNAAFDRESNDTVATAQNVDGARAVFGSLSGGAGGSTVTLNATNSGWWTGSGSHDASNPNYLLGYSNGQPYRNFFVFSLSGISQPISGAQLNIFNPSGGYSSADPSETIEFFDVSTAIASLIATGSGQVAIFNDLGTGVSYGSRGVTGSDNGTTVSTTLSDAAVAALNAAVGGQFAIGGAMTTISGTLAQYFFGNTGSGTRQLVLTLGQVASDDYYTVTLAAGQTLALRTSTPADGPGQFANALDPSLELFEPGGAKVAADNDSAGDGRNAALTYTVLAAGTYRIRVTAAGATTGEYVLSVETSTAPGTTPPGAPDLLTASDTGISTSDNLTKLNNASAAAALSFAVPNTIAGATVSLYYNGTMIGSAVATGSTTVVTTDGMTTIPDGTWSITARQTVAGVESADSAALSVTVDTFRPSVTGSPDLAAASDSGASSSDNVTNDNTPTFNLSALPYFRFYRNGVLISGEYQTGSSMTLPWQQDGTWTYTVHAVDAAGNVSETAGTLVVTIDTVAPVVTTPDLQAGRDTGVSSTDNVTRDSRPTVDVTTTEASTIYLSVNGTQVGTASVGGAGTASMPAHGPSTGFGAAQGYAVNGTTTSVGPIAADVNADGNADLVAFLARGISVLLGRPDGTFAPGVSFSTGTRQVKQGFTADFNADGKLDLVTANTVGSVSVYIGNGDGTFAAPLDMGNWGSDSVFSVAVADFNGDGKPDVVAANATSHLAAVFLNNGNGTFLPALTHTLASNFWPWYVAATDLDGDGKQDLVLSDPNEETSRVVTLLGNGDGTFSAGSSLAISNPLDLIPGDFNGDGKGDVAVRRHFDSSVTVLLGGAGGVLTVAGKVSPFVNGPHGIAVGHFDADNKLDLAVLEGGVSTNRLNVYRGNGDGTFALARTATTPWSTWGLAAADYNGDGQVDFACTDGVQNGQAFVVLAAAAELADGAHAVTAYAEDLAGNSSAPSPSLTITIDTTRPTATISPVQPTPRTTPVPSATVTFSEVVAGLTPGHLALTRNAGANLLGPGQTTSPGLGNAWSLDGLTAVTGVAGEYRLAFASGAGVTDLAGNPLQSLPAAVTWTTYAAVVGRHVFYNNSYYDGNLSGANVRDDAAVAVDKAALLPGGAAAFANYTSYSKGINGVMIDVAGLPGTTLSASDFVFQVGNVDTTGDWTPAPAPVALAVRKGAGVGGSDRVTLVFADGAIRKQWLQVTLRATAGTGLSAADVFYFGNAVGETGDQPGDAIVNSADQAAIRVNPRNFLNRALITDRHDINRDSFVDATDQALARDNGTTAATALRLIRPADPVAVAASSFVSPASRPPVTPSTRPAVVTATDYLKSRIKSGNVSVFR